jgi:hypothetical protein
LGLIIGLIYFFSQELAELFEGHRRIRRRSPDDPRHDLIVSLNARRAKQERKARVQQTA